MDITLAGVTGRDACKSILASTLVLTRTRLVEFFRKSAERTVHIDAIGLLAHRGRVLYVQHRVIVRAMRDMVAKVIELDLPTLFVGQAARFRLPALGFARNGRFCRSRFAKDANEVSAKALGVVSGGVCRLP